MVKTKEESIEKEKIKTNNMQNKGLYKGLQEPRKLDKKEF